MCTTWSMLLYRLAATNMSSTVMVSDAACGPAIPYPSFRAMAMGTRDRSRKLKPRYSSFGQMGLLSSLIVVHTTDNLVLNMKMITKVI